MPDGLTPGTRPALVAIAPRWWAVVSQVPAGRYGSSALERGLRDLEWVGRVALAHERVVEHFAGMRGVTVVPLKLFTMFSSAERAAAELKGRRRALDRVARRIAGAQEWGLRITRLPAAGRSAATAVRPSSGTAFLAAKRRVRDAAAASRAAVLEAAEAAYESLAALSRDARRRDPRQEPGTNPPVLEAALLVPIRSRAAFGREARRQATACAKAGASMAITGPWPAYNFVQPAEKPR